MSRLCLAALGAAILLSLSATKVIAETTVEDVGCIDGGERFGYQMIHRIIIWNDNNLTYLEEIPCGSNRWYERGRVSGTPPTVLTNPGIFTTTGTIEFSQSSPTAGIITAGTGPDARDFISAPATLKLVISAPVVQSLLNSLQ